MVVCVGEPPNQRILPTYCNEREALYFSHKSKELFECRVSNNTGVWEHETFLIVCVYECGMCTHARRQIAGIRSLLQPDGSWFIRLDGLNPLSHLNVLELKFQQGVNFLFSYFFWL